MMHLPGRIARMLSVIKKDKPPKCPCFEEVYIPTDVDGYVEVPDEIFLKLKNSHNKVCKNCRFHQISSATSQPFCQLMSNLVLKRNNFLEMIETLNETLNKLKWEK